MTYRCLLFEPIAWQEYQVISLRQQDIFAIKKWRNAQMDVLRQQTLLTDQGQQRYFEQVVLPTMQQEHPMMVLFSFLQRTTCIGYGGLTNLDWHSKRAEISFLLDTERIETQNQYRQDFTAFLKLMKMVAFEQLKLNRLFTETFDMRPLHISILEQNGFLLEGRMRKHVYKKGQFVDSLLHGCLAEEWE